jgi:hypothetical protein
MLANDVDGSGPTDGVRERVRAMQRRAVDVPDAAELLLDRLG